MAAHPLTEREYAYFCISGPGTHEEITALLGFEPSEAWNIGDINPQNGMPRKFMSWRLSSGLDDKNPLDEHLKYLFQCLKPRTSLLRQLWVDFDLTLQCVGYFAPSSHGASFSREQVRVAAQLGLEFVLDFYYLNDFGHEI